MSRIPPWIRNNLALPWALLFLALSLSVTQLGGTNSLSRWAALRAITEGHTLSIDNYKDWTIDWSRAPSGHLYSNKAPGAVFLELPVFALTELVSLNLGRPLDEKGRAPAPGYISHLLVVLSAQILPFALLVLWIVHQLGLASHSRASLHFFSLAALFGNTAALYMNSNFGHGLAALLFLASFWLWWRRQYALAGVFISWCLLTDYGTAFALPFFMLSIFWRERALAPCLKTCVGALPGAIVWVAYHWFAFGSPFATANQFINPEQVELASGSLVLWGSFSPFPSSSTLLSLLFGSSRGLLFTQPWVLFIFVLPFLQEKARARGSLIFSLGSLVGLLWMNAGFGSWHGGWCLGPRYMALLFPALALMLTLSWEGFPKIAQRGLFLGLGISLLFRLLTFPFSNLAPNENLWLYHLRLFALLHSPTSFLRLGIALVLIALAVWWQRRLTRRAFAPNAQRVI